MKTLDASSLLIEKIANETRKELENFSRKVHIRGSNKQTLQGFCLIGTYLFCGVATEFNIETVPVYGKYCRLGSFSMNPDNPYQHWWADCNGIVVDVTVSQFIIDKIYIGKPENKYWELSRGFDFTNWAYAQSPVAYEKILKISQENIVNALLL
jgi:hypothetical protein